MKQSTMLQLALAAALCTSSLPGNAAQQPMPAEPPASADAGIAAPAPGVAPDPEAAAQEAARAEAPAPSSTRSGGEIYRAFRDGLAEPECGNADPRWLRHFAHAPDRLADPGSDALPLFGHVVDTLRDAHLPTEFALIPFIESGYAPGARSGSGPAGLWQFVSLTARHHGIAVGKTYDGRLSPAESTSAAVRYLKTLNGMFADNWRIAAMAYNAGEYRLLQALRRNGTSALEATPSRVSGLSQTTYAYVEKLHALACLLEQAGEDPGWLAAVDREVPNLQALPLEDVRSLDQWATAHNADTALLRRINPALAGRWPARGTPLALVQPVLTDRVDPATAGVPGSTADSMPSTSLATEAASDTVAALRTHTVRSGDSAWAIARRHGLSTARLLELNGLGKRSILRPGTVLKLD